MTINLLKEYWGHQHQRFLKVMGMLAVLVLVCALLAITYLFYAHQNKKDLESKIYQLQKELSQQKAVVTQPIIVESAPISKPGMISWQQTHADIREVLQKIAQVGSVNLLLHESVQGTISVLFKELFWKEALQVVLDLGDLISIQEENILLIRSAKEEATRLQNAIQQQTQKTEIAALETKLMPIYYAKAKNIAELITQKDQEWLSPRGSLSVDHRTNSMVIRDIPAQISAIEEMVRALDVPIRQVAIEARILNVQENVSKELGLTWTTGANGVDVALASISADVLFNLELKARNNKNLVEELAHPRLVTADQQTAIIRQGEEVPYQQSAEYGATSVSFKPAVLELQVTPHITPDNHVILKLLVKNDSRGTQNLADNVPVITTKEIRTQVLINNGQTLVLGGIYTEGKNDQKDNIPFFSDLPLIGGLFKSKTRTNERKELLVLVTPRIIVE